MNGSEMFDQIEQHIEEIADAYIYSKGLKFDTEADRDEYKAMFMAEFDTMKEYFNFAEEYIIERGQ
jgi:hypothetical protein